MLLQPISREYIAIDPNYCFGKPRLAGTRMPVAAIAEMYLEMGESIEDIARKYDLSLAAVHGAMVYYYEHQEELDLHNLETEKIVEAMKRNTPASKFQEKWRKIRSEG